MGTGTFRTKADQENPAEQTPCWELSSSFFPCWEVESEELPCWEFLKDSKQPDVPDYPEDKEKKLPYNVFAIHIKFGEIFLAVKMRDPDTPDGWWIDDFVSALTHTADGKFAYHPEYFGTDFGKAFETNTPEKSIPYEVKLDSNNKKFLVFKEENINLNVEYKVVSDALLIKGTYRPDYNQHKYFADFDGSYITLQENQVGDGCLLMAHETSEVADPIFFKDAQGGVHRIKIFGGFEIDTLPFAKANYMLTKEWAYNTECLARFNLVTGESEDSFMYVNNWHESPNAYSSMPVYTHIMQNTKESVGFPKYTVPKDYQQGFHQRLITARRDPAQSSGWSGVGSTGHVVGGEPYNPDLIFRRRPHYIPLDILANYDDDNTIDGLMPYRYSVTDEYVFTKEHPPHENQIRISTEEYWFIGAGEQLISIKRYDQMDYTRQSYSFAQVIAPISETADFCFYGVNLIVADGTEKIKIYPKQNHLLPSTPI